MQESTKTINQIASELKVINDDLKYTDNILKNPLGNDYRFYLLCELKEVLKRDKEVLLMKLN